VGEVTEVITPLAVLVAQPLQLELLTLAVEVVGRAQARELHLAVVLV
jgi:hypothetical protein